MSTLFVELLALDLNVCDRCGGTLANIRTALQIARPTLTALGFDVSFAEKVVTNEAQAEYLRFASSPTIRINGRDILSTMSESPCGNCSDLCGCGGGVECRVWPWRGESHDAAPVGLIVEALLKAAIVPETLPSPRPWSGVPSNLVNFFTGVKDTQPIVPAGGSCCAAAGGR